MREIVHVQLGQCGNRVGEKFWKEISQEHGLNPFGRFVGAFDRRLRNLQLQRINVYFVESAARRYVPRAILVDPDQRGVQPVLFGPCGQLFKRDNVVQGTNGARNNWARGYYTEGAQLADSTLERVRTEAENCDLIQGIQIVHALGGGTGSGMGCLLAQNIIDEYPDRVLKSYVVMPSWKVSKIQTQPYNLVLSMNHLIECFHQVYYMDNDALYCLCKEVLRLSCVNDDEMNTLIATCMSNITTSLRFPGQLNADLRKLQVNMVPFPRLHFFVPGYVPIYPALFPRLTEDMISGKSMYAYCNPKTGLFLTFAVIFRGNISPKCVDEQMCSITTRNKKNFVRWIPHNVKTTICDVPPPGVKLCATSLSNTTSIRGLLATLSDIFQRLFEEKAFLHWYINEGMEESEFTEAHDKLLSLISEYQEYEKNHNGSEELTQ